MDMVVPRDKEKSFLLRDCFIKACNISMKNETQDIRQVGYLVQQVKIGSTVEVDLSVSAATIETINEPYETAAVREKRVRDCSLGELILAIAGKV